MYPRPTTPSYQELSANLQQAIQMALLGQAAPAEALAAAVEGGL
jgi:multiple sugar transport system substrate-binding protein